MAFHLSKFQAKKVADFIRTQPQIEGNNDVADSIENSADSDGMIYHFAVSDWVGGEHMRAIECVCPMYMELERASK